MKKTFFFIWILAFDLVSVGQIKPELYLQSGHGSDIVEMQTSPDESRIITIDENGALLAWNLSSGRQFYELGDLKKAVFWNDNNVIGLNRSNELLKINLGQTQSLPEKMDDGVNSVHFLDYEKVLICRSKLEVMSKNGTEVLQIGYHPKMIFSQLNQDEFYFIQGDSLCGYNIQKNELRLIRQSSKFNKCTAIEVYGDLVLLMDKSSSWMVRLEDGKMKGVYNVSSFQKRFVGISANGSIALIQSDGEIDILSDELKLKQSYNSHLSNASNIQLLQNGRVLLVAKDENVVVLDVATGKLLNVLEGRTGEVSFASFDKNGKGIIVGFKNGGIRYVPVDPLNQTRYVRVPQKSGKGAEKWELNVLGCTDSNGLIYIHCLNVKWNSTHTLIKRSTSFNMIWNLKTGAHWMEEIDNQGYSKKKAPKLEDLLGSIQIKPVLHSKKYNMNLKRKGNQIFLESEDGNDIEVLVFGEGGTLYKKGMFYFANKGLREYLSFRVDGALFLFDQFDPFLNHPYKVFGDMKILPPDKLELMKKAYESRLKNLGGITLDDIPIEKLPRLKLEKPNELVWDNTTYEFTLSTVGGDRLKSVMLQVNGVPIYGKDGMEFSGENTAETINVDLEQGENLISVFVFNEQGFMSNVEEFSVYTNFVSQPTLYVMGVGVSDYDDDKFDLQYPAKDANDMVDVLKDSKHYDQIRTTVLKNPNSDQFSVEIKEFLKEAEVNDIIVFYYAGHGVLDENYEYYLCPADMDFNHPAVKGVPFDEIETILSGLPCRNRIIFLDACHSGEIDKDEIVEMDTNEEFSEDIVFRSSGAALTTVESGVSYLDLSKMLFEDTRSNHGNFIISSASGVEFAIESGKWENGLFTYFIKEGINSYKADLDGDRTIRLRELFNYVSAAVVEHSNGMQHPRIRIEIEGVNPVLQ